MGATIWDTYRGEGGGGEGGGRGGEEKEREGERDCTEDFNIDQEGSVLVRSMK